MVKIRLLYPFTFDHIELPAGEVISVSPERANRLVSIHAAEYAEPQHAVVEPREMRALIPATDEQLNDPAELVKIAAEGFAPIKRPRGRPRKIDISNALKD